MDRGQSRSLLTIILSLPILAMLALALFFAAPAPPGNAAFSGYNGKIAYHAAWQNYNAIYVMDFDSEPSRLTSNGADDISPKWSPDGSRITFASNRDGNYEIYSMNADGTGQTRQTNNPADDIEPTWSPDGARIAFASARDGNYEIYVMNADGTGPINLTNNAGHDRDPDWSPDGTKIVFSSSGRIYTMNADGSAQMQLTGSGIEESDPTWSPDGSRIAFSRLLLPPFIDNGKRRIVVMNADGSGQTTLPSHSGEFSLHENPAWSPDGYRIAFALYTGTTEIATMDADGSARSYTGRSGWDPDWQPLPCSGMAPLLTLQRKNVFWASMEDYTARRLSIDYIISGEENAYDVRIVGSSNTNAVTVATSLPLSIGKIRSGDSSPFTLKYDIPPGVRYFASTSYATAKDSCNNSFSYPAPWPDT